VHVPAERAEQAAQLVGGCLTEATRRWAPGGRVRFIAEITIAGSWADAKS